MKEQEKEKEIQDTFFADFHKIHVFSLKQGRSNPSFLAVQETCFQLLHFPLNWQSLAKSRRFVILWKPNSFQIFRLAFYFGGSFCFSSCSGALHRSSVFSRYFPAAAAFFAGIFLRKAAAIFQQGPRRPLTNVPRRNCNTEAPLLPKLNPSRKMVVSFSAFSLRSPKILKR